MAITAAALIGGGSALSAGSSLLGSGKSSSASKSASLYAYDQYLQNAATLQPFVAAGNNVGIPGMERIAGATPASVPYLANAAQYYQTAAGMTPPSVVTENWLQQTPGYQWQLGQGLQATQAAAAARGLGVSGSSLKGAATYATGLADANYQNQYNNAQTAWQDVMNQGAAQVNLGTAANQAQSQQYNMYSALGTIGANAAAQTATSGTQLGQTSANYLNQAGQAQAAGTTGAASALTSGVNNYLSYSALNQALQGSINASTTQNASALNQMIGNQSYGNLQGQGLY